MIIRETKTVDTTEKLKAHSQSSEGSSRRDDTEITADQSVLQTLKHTDTETETYPKNGNRNPKTRQPQESKTSDAPDQTL